MPSKREFGLMLLASLATLCIGLQFLAPVERLAATLSPGDLWLATYTVENDPDKIDLQADQIATAVQRHAMKHRHAQLVLTCSLATVARPNTPSRITWPRAD